MSDIVTVQVLPDEVINVNISSDEIIAVTITDGDTVVATVSDGAPNASSVTHETITAGAVLSANKVVVPDSSGKFVYADKDTLSHMHCVYGVTTQSIELDATGIVQTYGQLSNNTWSWVIGNPIYLGNSGELTQTAPSSGFCSVVGFAVTATKMFIDIGVPIELI